MEHCHLPAPSQSGIDESVAEEPCSSEHQQLHEGHRHLKSVVRQHVRLVAQFPATGGARTNRSDTSSGIENLLRIECGLDCKHHFAFGLADHVRHVRRFENPPDTVFTADRSAQRQCAGNDVVESSARTILRTRFGSVEHDGRVEIAVGGVTEGSDRDAVAIGRFTNAFQHGRQRRHRHRDVVEKYRAQRLESRQGHAARGGELFTFHRIVGVENLSGPGAFARRGAVRCLGGRDLPSHWMSSIAPADSSSPILVSRLTAPMVTSSINSI